MKNKQTKDNLRISNRKCPWRDLSYIPVNSYRNIGQTRGLSIARIMPLFVLSRSGDTDSFQYKFSNILSYLYFHFKRLPRSDKLFPELFSERIYRIFIKVRADKSPTVCTKSRKNIFLKKPEKLLTILLPILPKNITYLSNLKSRILNLSHIQFSNHFIGHQKKTLNFIVNFPKLIVRYLST